MKQTNELINQTSKRIQQMFKAEAQRLADQCTTDHVPPHALIRAALDNVAERYSLEGNKLIYNRLRKL